MPSRSLCVVVLIVLVGQMILPGPILAQPLAAVRPAWLVQDRLVAQIHEAAYPPWPFNAWSGTRRLGVSGGSAYVNPTELYEEVEAARQVYHRGGFAVLDVTDKPIEESAEEIISLVTRRLKGGAG